MTASRTSLLETEGSLCSRSCNASHADWKSSRNWDETKKKKSIAISRRQEESEHKQRQRILVVGEVADAEKRKREEERKREERHASSTDSRCCRREWRQRVKLQVSPSVSVDGASESSSVVRVKRFIDLSRASIHVAGAAAYALLCDPPAFESVLA